MQTHNKYNLTVNVHRRFHRGAIRLFLHFEIHNEIQRLVQNELNGRWSRSHKGWYVDDTPEMKDRIIAICKGRAWYNLREINKYLEPEAKELIHSGKTLQRSTSVGPAASLGVNQKDFDDYVHYLKALGKSTSTINTYSGMVRRLAVFYNKQLIRHLTPEHIYTYLSREVVDRKMSNSYHRQLISALKHFYRDKEDLELDIVSDLIYPGKHKKLPVVISEEDVIKILRATRNLKHRLAYSMLYSCGLRISELLNLKINEIDLERRTVFVRESKGFKDRVVMLAESVVPMLHNYLHAYHPVEYLFNGQSGLKYSAESVRKSLHNVRKEAGIQRKVTPHTLRHSFATHLLEQGVGIRYIQELLGHNKPETTMLYTYVANDRLMQVLSPLDHIVSKITHQPNDNFQLPKSGL